VHGSIDMLRNALVTMAQGACCSHLIMVDTDMVYPEDTIQKLMSYNEPIVGALCFRRSPPFEPFMIKDDKYIRTWEPGSLVEVDRTGTGCLLIDMRVFDTLKKPWFETVTNEKGGIILGEDFNFCDKAREAGYSIFVDTSTEVGHLSTMCVDQKVYRFFEGVKEIKHDINGGEGNG